MDGETFPEWLKRQLLRREWTQADLARRLETSPGIVSHWIRGERVPSPESCERLAEAFARDVDEVLTRAGHRPEIEPLQPDDSKQEFRAMISRLEMTPDKEVALRGLLRAWLEADAQARQAKEDGR